MKNSYTAHIKQQMETTKQTVMRILRLTELDYSTLQLKMGRRYLQSYISTDPAGIDMLVESKIFWAWWRNQWLIRDMQFTASNVANIPHGTAMSIYLTMHDADVLIQSIYPSSAVLDNSYAQMIDQVIKAEI